MRFRDAEDASYGGGDAPVVARRSREIAAVAGNDAAVYDAMTTAGNGNGAVPYTSSDASPRVSQESGATKLPAEAPVPRREHHVTNAARLVDKVFKKHSGVGASEARGAAAVDSAPQKALTASTPGLDGDARKEDASSGGSIDKKEDATIGSSIEKKEESRSSKKNLETKLPVASKKLAPVKTKPLAPNRVAQKQRNRQQPTSTISGRFNERLVTQKPSKKTTAPPSSIFANEPRRPMSKGRANILRQLESLGKDLERERIEQAIQITSLQRDAHRYQR